MHLSRSLLLASLLLAMLLPARGDAATFCVSSTSALESALAQVQTNLDTQNTIRVVAGTYIIGASAGFVSDAGPPGIVLPHKDLVLSGGWRPGCTGKDFGAQRTVISGPSVHLAFLFRRSALRIEDLTFLNFSSFRIYDATETGPSCTRNGRRWELDRVISENVGLAPGSPGTPTMGLRFTVECHPIDIRNTMVRNPRALGFGVTWYGSNPESILTLVNSTFHSAHGNVLTLGSGVGEPLLYRGTITNTIAYLTASGGNGLDFRGAYLLGRSNIFSSTFTVGAGGFWPGSENNLVANPQLDFQLRPVAGSPALNSGAAEAPGGISQLDVIGNPRWTGSLPERGAYESNSSDANVLTVTSTGSSGAGTLRDAILTANASPANMEIRFNIAGACPRVISLASPLPDITSNLVIDATTQPGFVANRIETLTSGFDAQMCVVVNGNDRILRALRVPQESNARLTVKGLGFGRFTSAAIELRGGTGHVLEHNQFGNSVAGYDLRSNGNNIVIHGASARIGGPGAAQRNYISGANGEFSHGILATGNGSVQIINNRIGTTLGGTGHRPNNVGIAVSGPNKVVLLNLVRGNGHNGINLAAAEEATVAGNVIRANGSAGINISSGGSSRVGCREGFFCAGNTIRDNGSHGVLVSSSNSNFIERNEIHGNGGAGVRIPSGRFNRVRENEIYGNTGLGIDIAGAGVTANTITGSCDASMPNCLQNHPVLTEASGSSSQGVIRGSVSGYGSASTPQIAVDLYSVASCDPRGHGQARRYLGSTSVLLRGFTTGWRTRTFRANVTTSGIGLDDLVGKDIVAVATRTAGGSVGSSSEFSQCIRYQVPEPGGAALGAAALAVLAGLASVRAGRPRVGSCRRAARDRSAPA